MCFHTELKKHPKKIKAFQVINKTNFPDEPLYHISGFGHPKTPVIINDNNLVLIEMYWGLIPSWCKDWNYGKKIRSMTLNARIESVTEKPSFRSSVKTNHCLIPITGFFEWHTIGKNKYPFYIYPKNEDFFILAGIWDNWVNKDTGEIYETYSILTTNGNELMTKIHNSKKRMPVILDPKNAELWLKNEQKLMDLLDHISVPYDQSEMVAHSISKLITSKNENSNTPNVSGFYDYGIKDPIFKKIDTTI